MRGNNDRIHIEDHLSVISLKRTPQRLKSFFGAIQLFKTVEYHVLDGVDGASKKNYSDNQD